MKTRNAKSERFSAYRSEADQTHFDPGRMPEPHMQVSFFCAQLLGPMFIVVGVALAFNQDLFRNILSQFIASPIWLYFAGFLGLLAGLTLVLIHNVWTADWRLIITLIGWVTLVRALISIFRPQWVVAAGTAIMNHRGIFAGAAVLNLLIGLVLTFFGYTSLL